MGNFIKLRYAPREGQRSGDSCLCTGPPISADLYQGIKLPHTTNNSYIPGTGMMYANVKSTKPKVFQANRRDPHPRLNFYVQNCVLKSSICVFSRSALCIDPVFKPAQRTQLAMVLRAPLCAPSLYFSRTDIPSKWYTRNKTFTTRVRLSTLRYT